MIKKMNALASSFEYFLPYFPLGRLSPPAPPSQEDRLLSERASLHCVTKSKRARGPAANRSFGRPREATPRNGSGGGGHAARSTIQVIA